MARTRRADYTVLGCLSLRPMSGYDIKKFVDRSIAHFWRESYGQIYPSLRKLEAEGMVTGETETRGRRNRRVYTITERGLRKLRDWLLEPAAPDVPRYETSLKLFFGEQMPLSMAIEHIERYREHQVRQLEMYREQAARLESRVQSGSHPPHWRIVLRGGVDYAEMAIRWCDRALRDLRRLDPERYPADPPTLPARTPSGD